jgi:hypothetical protein
MELDPRRDELQDLVFCEQMAWALLNRRYANMIQASNYEAVERIVCEIAAPRIRGLVGEIGKIIREQQPTKLKDVDNHSSMGGSSRSVSCCVKTVKVMRAAPRQRQLAIPAASKPELLRKPSAPSATSHTCSKVAVKVTRIRSRKKRTVQSADASAQPNSNTPSRSTVDRGLNNTETPKSVTALRVRIRKKESTAPATQSPSPISIRSPSHSKFDRIYQTGLRNLEIGSPTHSEANSVLGEKLGGTNSQASSPSTVSTSEPPSPDSLSLNSSPLATAPEHHCIQDPQETQRQGNALTEEALSAAIGMHSATALYM